MERRDLFRWGLGSSLLLASGALLKSLLWPEPLSAEEGAGLRAFAESLLPSDPPTLAVLPGLLRILNQSADVDRALRRVARRGTRWLDVEAAKLAAKSFASLNANDRVAILTRASAEPPGSVPRVFCDRLRIEILRLYYSRADIAALWHYPAAPQPAGYPDYTSAP